MIRKFVEERLTHMLNRPEMWASSPEALEGMVLQLLWVRDANDAATYNDLRRFYHAKFPDFTGPTPLWQQKTISVQEMAGLLKEFVAGLQGPKRMNRLDLFKDEKKPLTLREFEQALGEMVTDFANDFDVEKPNDFMKESHPFWDWMRSFGQWLSF